MNIYVVWFIAVAVLVSNLLSLWWIYQSFFDKKERELSHKFNVGEEPNRQKESSLDDFIANATSSDVFTESLKSEDCVEILHNC